MYIRMYVTISDMYTVLDISLIELTIHMTNCGKLIKANLCSVGIIQQNVSSGQIAMNEFLI